MNISTKKLEPKFQPEKEQLFHLKSTIKPVLVY